MIDRMDHPIATAFAPLIGLPCWGAERVHGSILSFEFGSPSLVVREPRVSNSSSSKVRRTMARRIVKPAGEWHLLIYCCHWRVVASGEPVADDISAMETIEAAIREVDGQKLSELRLDAGSRTTAFALDLGATLTTWPYEADVDDQWSLYLPDGQVLTYRSDGHYSLGPGNIEPGQEVWHLVADSVASIASNIRDGSNLITRS